MKENNDALNLFIILESINKISLIENVKEQKAELDLFWVMLEDVKNDSRKSVRYAKFIEIADYSYLIAHKLYVGNILLEINNKHIIDQYGSYVYLLISKYGVKIGKSKTPKTRIKNISTQMPFKITKIESFKVNHMTNCETYLHKKYKNKRLNGEWFNLNEKEYLECVKYLSAQKVIEVKERKSIK